MLLDDDFILGLNKSLLSIVEEQMAKGIEKIHLTNISGRAFKEEKDVNFNIWEQSANYRLSLQPIVTRRDYFLKYLKPGRTIWEYEIQTTAMNDGARILIPKQDVVSYSNFIHKGKVSGFERAKIKKEDLDAIKQLGVF